MKKNNRICMFLCAAFVSLCLAAGGSMADTEPDTKQVKGYPASFDGEGVIDCLNDGYISIDDLALNISPAVSYNTPYSLNCSRAWFSVGKHVGYLLDSKGEVKSLWLINRNN